MRKFTTAALILASLLAGGSAMAQEDSGLQIGARLGYGIPMGDIAEKSEMTDYYSGQIPIWLDVGYRVNPNIMVGGYFQYGIVMLDSEHKDMCDKAKADCSAHDMRFGVQAHYHLSPEESMDPWLGLGVGYEMLGGKDVSIQMSDGTISTSSVDVSIDGLEFLNLQAGLDFEAGEGLGVGPFVSFSLGQFSSMSKDGKSDDIKNKAMHQWLVLGVRGAFDM